MKLLAILAALLVMPAPAQARPPLPPPQVWINPVDGHGIAAYYAAGILNRHTRTKLVCQVLPAEPGIPTPRCAPAPCPNPKICLTIRWGAFDDDTQDARLIWYACLGGCTKAAAVELNPDGPLYGGPQQWTPLHHRLLLEQQMGLFAGLTARTDCVSSMSPYWCAAEGFTAAEVDQLERW